MKENCLTRKLRLISKFITSQPGKWANTIHILPNIPRSKGTNCTKLYNDDPEMSSILIFFKKGLGIISPPHFVYDFSEKMFPLLYSIKWPNFIVRFPLLLEILGNICIVIICYQVCDVIYFEIDHSFLITRFSYMTKRSGQKIKYLNNEQSF